MFRTTDVILIGVMVAAAGLTFKVKYDAELKLEEIRRLQAEIQTEADTIDVLRADLSVLTQPARLQKLVDAYNGELQLEPVEPDQVSSMDRIAQTLRAVSEIAALQTKASDGATDDVQTGAVSE
jgi:hypothetical protein